MVSLVALLSKRLCVVPSHLRGGRAVYQGELALTIMGIDGEVTPEVMERLKSLSVR